MKYATKSAVINNSNTSLSSSSNNNSSSSSSSISCHNSSNSNNSHSHTNNSNSSATKNSISLSISSGIGIGNAIDSNTTMNGGSGCGGGGGGNGGGGGTTAATNSGTPTTTTTPFYEQVSTVMNLFEKWNDCERTVVMCAMLKRLTYPSLKFLQYSIDNNMAQTLGSQSNLTTVVMDMNANNPSYLQNLLNAYKTYQPHYQQQQHQTQQQQHHHQQQQQQQQQQHHHQQHLTLLGSSDLIDTLSSSSSSDKDSLPSCYGSDFQLTTAASTSTIGAAASTMNMTLDDVTAYKYQHGKKEDILHEVLSMLPLLKPGNEDAKLIYMTLIPIAVKDTMRQIVPTELVQQIFSYLLIHPAITSDDRKSLNVWLRHLEEHIQSAALGLRDMLGGVGGDSIGGSGSISGGNGNSYFLQPQCSIVDSLKMSTSGSSASSSASSTSCSASCSSSSNLSVASSLGNSNSNSNCNSNNNNNQTTHSSSMCNIRNNDWQTIAPPSKQHQLLHTHHHNSNSNNNNNKNTISTLHDWSTVMSKKANSLVNVSNGGSGVIGVGSVVGVGCNSNSSMSNNNSNNNANSNNSNNNGSNSNSSIIAEQLCDNLNGITLNELASSQNSLGLSLGATLVDAVSSCSSSTLVNGVVIAAANVHAPPSQQPSSVGVPTAGATTTTTTTTLFGANTNNNPIINILNNNNNSSHSNNNIISNHNHNNNNNNNHSIGCSSNLVNISGSGDDHDTSFSKNGTEILDFDPHTNGSACNTCSSNVSSSQQQHQHQHTQQASVAAAPQPPPPPPPLGYASILMSNCDQLDLNRWSLDSSLAALKTRRSNSLTTHTISSSSSSSNSSVITANENCSNSTENLAQYANKPRSFSLSIEHQRSGLTAGGSDTRLDEFKPSYIKFQTRNVGMSSIGLWLKSLRLHKYIDLFKNMTYEEMLQISEEYLQSLGVTKGASHKLALCIEKLKERPQNLAKLEHDLLSGQVKLQTAIEELANVVLTPMKPIETVNVSLTEDNVALQFLKVVDLVCSIVQKDPYAAQDDDGISVIMWILDRSIHNEAFLNHVTQLKELKFKFSKLKMSIAPKMHHVKPNGTSAGNLNKPRWNGKTRKCDLKNGSNDRINHRKNSNDMLNFSLSCLQQQHHHNSHQQQQQQQQHQYKSSSYPNFISQQQQQQPPPPPPPTAIKHHQQQQHQQLQQQHQIQQQLLHAHFPALPQQQQQQQQQQQPHRRSLNNLIVISQGAQQPQKLIYKPGQQQGILTSASNNNNNNSNNINNNNAVSAENLQMEHVCKNQQRKASLTLIGNGSNNSNACSSNSNSANISNNNNNLTSADILSATTNTTATSSTVPQNEFKLWNDSIGFCFN